MRQAAHNQAPAGGKAKVRPPIALFGELNSFYTWLTVYEKTKRKLRHLEIQDVHHTPLTFKNDSQLNMYSRH